MSRYRALLPPLVLPLLMACAATQESSEVQRVSFPEIKAPPPGPLIAEPYRIRHGDSVSIKFLHNPELNENVPVRADGRISLALVGEVTAQGLTLGELRAETSGRYKSFIAQTGYGELLKEGDDLQLRFVYNPELNIALIIRPDGKISLPLLGDVQAAGVRPGDLRMRLIEGYAKHIKNPDMVLLVGGHVGSLSKKIFADEAFIIVGLSKLVDQAVFVGGEVLTPRVVKFEGQLTTLQAIMMAGGVKETGDISQVIIVRRGEYEQGEWIKTNLSNPLLGKSLQNDVPLRNGDVVVVPMSDIAKVDLFVKQYIREVLPIQSNFTIVVEPIGPK